MPRHIMTVPPLVMLWAGLPVLTFLGATFSARMGGSLLKAAGLPELICNCQKEYEDLAIALGLNQSRCTEIKAILAANRSNTPLFDINTFTRNLELGLMTAHQGRINEMPLDYIIINSHE